MGTYATYSDVAARAPGRTVDANSKPTSTQVSAWVDEAESILTMRLKDAGAAMPVTDADGIKIMRTWACDYAEARLRMAWAAAGGDGGTDGEAALKRFDELLADIADKPAIYVAMVSAGSATAASTLVRSHVINNVDGDTIEDGDFDPRFTMDEVF